MKEAEGSVGMKEEYGDGAAGVGQVREGEQEVKTEGKGGPDCRVI